MTWRCEKGDAGITQYRITQKMSQKSSGSGSQGIRVQLPLPFMPPVRLCNRCNASKPSTAPCHRCGCPEFRIVGSKS